MVAKARARKKISKESEVDNAFLSHDKKSPLDLLKIITEPAPVLAIIKEVNLP